MVRSQVGEPSADFAADGGLPLTIALALAAVVALTVAERRLSLINFGAICLLWTVAAATLVTGDLNVALLVSVYLMTIIGLASRVKFAYVQQTLVARDLFYVVFANWSFLRRQYAAEALGMLLAFSVLTLALVAAVPRIAHAHVPLVSAAAFAAIATIILLLRDYRRSKAQPEALHLSSDQRHFSNFVRSIFHGMGPDKRFQLLDVAAEPMPLPPPRRASGDAHPDIILILHESTFDPRVHGLPVSGQNVAEFLSPADGLSGRLHVDVFGGRTWQSEFSILTGISSRCFGDNAEYVFHLAPGRIRHSLPIFLRERGYQTVIFAAGHSDDMNMDAFYEAVGFDDRRFPHDFGIAPRATRKGAHCDDVVYSAALKAWTEKAPNGPCFIAINTMMNHGPHRPLRWSRKQHMDDRQRARQSSGSRAYAEYCVRLTESALAMARFRAAKAAALGDRPAVFIRYGDHQPPFCASFKRTGNATWESLFQTFFVVEGQNFRLRPAAVGNGALLDIAFLPTIALQAAGISPDQFYEAQASLIEECRADYFGTDSERKRGFHRMLIDQQFISVDNSLPDPRPYHFR